MEIYDLTDKVDWSEYELEHNFNLLQESTPQRDFNNALNEVEGNGGNGIEINWDKYEVSYDCPMCIRKMMKDACKSKSERMWADHLTPIFNDTTKHNQHQPEEDDQPLEHISTCAFYYFQSPDTKFDIDYLDAVEKKEMIEFSAIEISPHQPQEIIKVKMEIKTEGKSSDYGSEDSEDPLTPIPDDVFGECMLDLGSEGDDVFEELDLGSEEEDMIDVESLDSDVLGVLENNTNNNNNHHHNHNHKNYNNNHNNHNNNHNNNNNHHNIHNNIHDNNHNNHNNHLNNNFDNHENNNNNSSDKHNSSNNLHKLENNHNNNNNNNHDNNNNVNNNHDNNNNNHNNNKTNNNKINDKLHSYYNHCKQESISEFHNYCTNTYQQQQQYYYKHHKQQHIKQQKAENDCDEDVEYYPPYYYNRTNHFSKLQSSPSSSSSSFSSPSSSSSNPESRNYRNKRSPRDRSPSPSYHPSHPYRHKRALSTRNRKHTIEETCKRAQHNVLERQRRSNLKELFISLKNHIPSMTGPFSTSKFSKVAILDNACIHVIKMVKEGDSLEVKLADLKRQYAQLVRALHQ